MKQNKLVIVSKSEKNCIPIYNEYVFKGKNTTSKNMHYVLPCFTCAVIKSKYSFNPKDSMDSCLRYYLCILSFSDSENT